MASSAGLSLFGFMDEPFAHAYLQTACEGAGATAAEMSKAWRDARTKLGAAFPKAGAPDVQPLPQTAQPHLRRVQNHNPRFKQTVGNLKWSFQSIEIDPLLCFQFHVEKARSAKACSGLTSKPPSAAEILSTCLPVGSAPLTHQVAPLSNGLFVRSNDLNVRLIDFRAEKTAGETWTAKVVWGPITPLISVVRYNGRYYLHNGYHRAHGLRQAGVDHMPCVLLEANAWSDFIDPRMVVFSESLLTSANAPTVGHFTQGRATDVNLRAVTRMLQISWSELALPDP